MTKRNTVSGQNYYQPNIFFFCSLFFSFSIIYTYIILLQYAIHIYLFFIFMYDKDGNTEYKRQLLNCTAARLEKLKTQISFRLDEGNGCCIYHIGVEDDGCHSLVDYDACAETAKLLEYLARSLNAVVLERKMIQNEVSSSVDGVSVSKVRESDAVEVMEESLLGDGTDQLFEDHQFKEEGYIELKDKQPSLDKARGVFTRCELTIQRVETHLLDPSPVPTSNDRDQKIRTNKKSPPKPTSNQIGENMSVGETLSSRNIRVAVVGNVDAGKSTMIGTLTSSLLDDGRGSSRTSIMKHRHEIESGRTSTASTHLMGFRSTGEAIAGRDPVRANRRKTEDEVARESYRVITLMDLAGHEKYLKTT